MKIVKARKVLTSEALNAEMIINENIRKANENARNVFEAYDNTKTYIKGNKVSYNGSSYVNLISCVGVIPTASATNWLIIASAGAGLTDASQLPITDTGNYYTTDNTGDALQEVGQRIGDLSLLETTSNTDLVVAINENATNINVLSKHRKGSINVAELVNCLGDGVNFDDVAFQYAVNNYRVVYVPEPDVYYRFEHKVSVPSNTTIIGLGLPFIYNDTANAEPVFEIVGTSEARLRRVKLKNLKIRNGTASAGAYTDGKDGIKVRYCDKYDQIGCDVLEIEGAFGLSTRYVKDITYQKNTSYRCTYAHFMILGECENIWIDGKNTFDTCTSLTTPDTYLLATGGDATIDSYSVKNLHIIGNRFLNNPRWEGIDSHGCENLWVEDNYVENVKCGIMLGLALGQVTNQVHKNLHVRGNTIKQGTGEDGSYGTYVAGAYNSSFYIPAENVVIENNLITGFGSATTSTVGVIHLQSTKNAKVIYNSVSLFKGHGIMTNSNNKKLTITENDIFNPTATDNISVSSGVTVRSNGNDVDIYKNKIYSDNINYPIKYGIGMFSNYSHVTASDNYILADTRYYNGGYFNVESATTPSVIYGIKGDYATNANDMRAYYCTDAVMRFNSGVPSGLTVTGTSGSNVLTIAGGSFLNVLSGLEVVITGGGTAGANLTTTVIDTTNTTIILKDNLGTSITGAVLSYTNATWVAA